MRPHSPIVPITLLFFAIGCLAAPSQSSPLIVSALNGDLHRVDSATAESTLIGSTGFDLLNAIDFDTDGTLYGATNNSLLTIDPDTAVSQLVGNFGPNIIVEGISIHQGELFGTASLVGNQTSDVLVKIDRTNAQVTPIGLINPAARDINAIASASSDLLIGADSFPVGLEAGVGFLYTISTESGEGTVASDLISRLITGLDTDETGMLYGTEVSEPGGSVQESKLLQIDPSTGIVTEIGDLFDINAATGVAIVPEPSTVLISVVVGTTLFSRRRRAGFLVTCHRN